MSTFEINQIKKLCRFKFSIFAAIYFANMFDDFLVLIKIVNKLILFSNKLICLNFHKLTKFFCSNCLVLTVIKTLKVLFNF